MHTIWVKAPYSGLYMAILNPLTCVFLVCDGLFQRQTLTLAAGDTYASPICYMVSNAGISSDTLQLADMIV